MKDGSVSILNEAVVDFGNDIGAGGIGFIAIDDIKEFVLDEEDPCHVGPGTITLWFEGREIEFGKCELIGMQLVENHVVG